MSAEDFLNSSQFDGYRPVMLRTPVGSDCSKKSSVSGVTNFVGEVNTVKPYDASKDLNVSESMARNIGMLRPDHLGGQMMSMVNETVATISEVAPQENKGAHSFAGIKGGFDAPIQRKGNIVHIKADPVEIYERLKMGEFSIIARIFLPKVVDNEGFQLVSYKKTQPLKPEERKKDMSAD